MSKTYTIKPLVWTQFSNSIQASIFNGLCLICAHSMGWEAVILGRIVAHGNSESFEQAKKSAECYAFELIEQALDEVKQFDPSETKHTCMTCDCYQCVCQQQKETEP